MWGILSVLTMSLTEMILSFQRTTSDGIGVLSHAYCALLRTRRIIFVSHLTIHFEMPTTSRWHYSRHYYRFEAAYPPSSGFFSLWRIRDTRPRKWELSDTISFALCSPYSFDTTKQPQIILWKRKKKKRYERNRVLIDSGEPGCAPPVFQFSEIKWNHIFDGNVTDFHEPLVKAE